MRVIIFYEKHCAVNRYYNSLSTFLNVASRDNL